MIRRILVIGGLGLAVAGGARFALMELTERRWERRREELLEMAVFLPKERRPWEVRFESLAERLGSSTRMDEIASSPYRPDVALGMGKPRKLDDFERVWVESSWNELAGLDGILVELRKLPVEALEWHGEAQKPGVLRGITDALCARAWLSAEAGDSERAAEAYADALRLARATTDETLLATTVRNYNDGTTLHSLRSVLSLGLSPSTLRARIEPLLSDWTYDASSAERVIRRELACVREFVGYEACASEAAEALRWFEPVEQALELASAPVEALAKLHGQPASSVEGSEKRLWDMSSGTAHLHARHAQRNVALTALALAAFRERHDRFAAGLAELELPVEQTLDPLDRKPLPYSHDDSSARVGPAAWGTRVDVPENLDDSLYVWTVR